MTRRAHARLHRHRQTGAALIIAVVLFALIGISAVIAVARGSDAQAEKDRRTAEALAQAKAALIGFAAGVVLNTNDDRPGDLPCPDLDDDGSAELSCGNAAGSNQDQRLGRLPWRTLGLPDLRDGDGERLWYAVSNSFKKKAHTSCNSPSDPGCLNSDSRGSITVRDSAGAIHNDGTNPNEWMPSGAIAVIIAPGAPITRQGAGAVQDRSPGGKLNAINYLDVALGEDNANFIDGGTNGFINGPVSAGGGVIVNDRVAVITYEDLMPVLERRVVREVSRCLDLYAARPANNGRYPWAVDTSVSATKSEDPTAAPSYSYPDTAGVRAGRIPEGVIGSTSANELFTHTRIDSGNTMDDTWPGAPCNLGLGYAWWMNWKLHVFYAVADAHKPGSTATCVDVPCLSVQTSATTILPDRQYVVAVGGKPLADVAGGQMRATAVDRANPQNYLEGENVFTSTPLDSFERRAASNTFNDVIGYR